MKDSKTLQIVSTVIESGVSEVTRRICTAISNIRRLDDVVMYQKNIDEEIF